MEYQLQDIINANNILKNKTENEIFININRNQFENVKENIILQIENCQIRSINLETKCKIIFKDCSIKYQSTIENNISSISFINCVFKDSLILDRNNNCTFTDCKFNKIIFGLNKSNYSILNLESKFISCTFDIIESKSDKIDKINFKKSIFKNIKSISKLNFDSNISIEQCIFNENENPEHYRKLKKTFIELRNDVLSDQFSFLELKAIYNNQSFFQKNNFFSNFIEKFIGFLYLTINNFGIKPYRPIQLLIILSLIIFYLTKEPNCTKNLENALVFFFNPFIILTKNKLSYCENITDTVTLLLNLTSAILWFFLIIGIRKRYKIDK